ncbi:MAG: putative Ig domain-containing protein, partial [Actinomycetaceae bacterium]|nr:putative Ig domain-containing protein [Actinomycetaceae bacterium]
MNSNLVVRKKLWHWTSGTMATLAAASLALTAIVAAGLFAIAYPAVRDARPGHDVKGGMICGMTYIEQGTGNNSGSNHTGGYFDAESGDIGLAGIKVHALLVKYDGTVYPEQDGAQTKPMTVVSNDKGEYCFDFHSVGLAERAVPNERKIDDGDYVKVWPEGWNQDKLEPLFFNAGGRMTEVETLHLLNLAQTTFNNGGIAWGGYYFGGANTTGGYIDGLNFSFKEKTPRDGGDATGPRARHLPESEWKVSGFTREELQGTKNRLDKNANNTQWFTTVLGEQPLYYANYGVENLTITPEDSDGDGVSDAQEVHDKTDPNDPYSYKDRDDDRVPDVVEEADGTRPWALIKANARKSFKDSDSDGVPDYVEIRQGTDPNDRTSFRDTDGDGRPNYKEYYDVKPYICGKAYQDIDFTYTKYQAGEPPMRNLRIVGSSAHLAGDDVTGTATTYYDYTDDEGRWCIVWDSYDEFYPDWSFGYSPKAFVTAEPEEGLNNVPYIPAQDPWMKDWILNHKAGVGNNHWFNFADPLEAPKATQILPYYSGGTQWGAATGIYRIAPAFFGFFPTTPSADYSENYGYVGQSFTATVQNAYEDTGPYKLIWAKEGTKIKDLDTKGTVLADVLTAQGQNVTLDFTVPNDAKVGAYAIYLVSVDESGNVRKGFIHDVDIFKVLDERGVHFDSAEKRDAVLDNDLLDEKSETLKPKQDEPEIDNTAADSKQVHKAYVGDTIYGYYRGIEPPAHNVKDGEKHEPYKLVMSKPGTAPIVLAEKVVGEKDPKQGEIALQYKSEFVVPTEATPGDYEILLMRISDNTIYDSHPLTVLNGPKLVVADPQSAKQGAISPAITVTDKRPDHTYKMAFVDNNKVETEIPVDSTTFTIPQDATLGIGEVRLIDITDGANPVVVAKDSLEVLDGQKPVIETNNVKKIQGQPIVLPVTVKDNVDSNLEPTCEPLPSWLKWNATTRHYEGTVPETEPVGDVTLTCNVTDKAGNKADPKTVKITVEKKPDDPALSVDKTSVEPGGVIHAKVVSPRPGKTYTAQLFDPKGMPIDTPVAVDSNGVDFMVPVKAADGAYSVKLFEDGNPDLIDEETITVTDKTAPVITAPKTITVQTAQSVPNTVTITAKDSVDDAVTVTAHIGPSGSGLTYDPSSGTLSGTAGEPGTYIINVTAKDTKGNQSSSTVTLIVTPDKNKPTIDNVDGLVGGQIKGKTGTAIQQVTVTASDDSGTVTLSVKDKTKFPAGLSFEPSTGVISGTPTKPGKGSFTILATDPSGNTSSVDIPYTIDDGVPPSVSVGKIEGTKNKPLNVPVSVSDDSGTVKCAATGLPAGLTIDDTTCIISGTPSEPGTGQVVITGTDPSGNDKTITVAYKIADTDADGDGIGDNEDKCPDTPKGEIADQNGCSASQRDTDHDGLNDKYEFTKCYDVKIVDGTGEIPCPANPEDQKKTQFNNADSDGDGVPDGQEVKDGTNPLNPGSFKDTDKDGIPDYVEDHDCYDPLAKGSGKINCPEDPHQQHHTDKNKKDSDGDGVPDGQEVKDGTNPLNKNDFKDSDGDGVPDAKDKCPNTPADAAVDANGCADSQKDSDGDGVKDDKDKCPDTPTAEKDLVDANGCADSQKDSDGDGVK